MLQDAVRDRLQFPRFRRRAGNGEIARGSLQVIPRIGVPGIQYRRAVDHETILVDLGRKHRSDHGPKTIRILLHGRHRAFELEINLLRIRRTQPEGHAIVRMDLGREIR